MRLSALSLLSLFFLSIPTTSLALLENPGALVSIVENGEPRNFTSQVRVTIEDLGRIELRIGGRGKGTTLENANFDMHLRLSADFEGEGSLDTTLQMMMIDQTLYGRFKGFSIDIDESELSLWDPGSISPPRDWFKLDLSEASELSGTNVDISTLDEEALEGMIKDIVDAVMHMQYAEGNNGGYEYALTLQDDWLREALHIVIAHAKANENLGITSEEVANLEEAMRGRDLWETQSMLNKALRFNWRIWTDRWNALVRSVQFIGFRLPDEGLNLTIKSLTLPTEPFMLVAPQRAPTLDAWFEAME